MIMRQFYIRILVGVGLLVGLGACSTVEQKDDASIPAPIAGAEPQALGSMTGLSKGMSVTELVELYGQPKEKTKIERDELVFERWIYVEPFRSRVDMVASRMEEVPYIDPLDRRKQNHSGTGFHSGDEALRIEVRHTHVRWKGDRMEAVDGNGAFVGLAPGLHCW